MTSQVMIDSVHDTVYFIRNNKGQAYIIIIKLNITKSLYRQYLRFHKKSDIIKQLRLILATYHTAIIKL